MIKIWISFHSTLPQGSIIRLSNVKMHLLTVETEDTSSTLLELAANNDVQGFSQLIERDPSSIDEVGLWYARQKGSKQMVLEHRTALMVAAMYGSIDVLKLILSLSKADVNRSCGVDKTTALHCAVSGGSPNAVDVVKLLLVEGADPNLIDVNGRRAVDVIVVSPKFPEAKSTLEKLIQTGGPVSISTDSPPLSPSPENGSPLSDLDSPLSPKASNFSDIKKEYPIDPSLPDIKNSIYSTDEFRMFSFKVRPCSRAYSHDWTECPFVHPSENARRRDPRKYHYSCVPCPDFRKAACRRGDMCEYAHGVFECWLHPAQYRTRLCKDGTSCIRRVCFFAHTQEELRPLYISTGSAVPSPRSAAANALDYAAAMSLLPGSPSSFTPPISPSGNGIQNMGWPQPNVPTLHLPGSNFQSSRLRSSLNARDIPSDDLNYQLINELSHLSLNNYSLNRSPVHAKTRLTPLNLDDIFSAENPSPCYSDQALASAVFSPRHNLLSPINTSFSPKNVDHSLLQSTFSVPSSGRMSPLGVDPISPMSARVSMLAREKQQFRSLSSRDLVSSSSDENWSKWGLTGGKVDCGVNAEDFGKLKGSSSFDNGNNGEEPDVSWVQSLVKESPQEMKERSNMNSRIEQVDPSVLSAWMEQMQLDQLVGQKN